MKRLANFQLRRADVRGFVSGWSIANAARLGFDWMPPGRVSLALYCAAIAVYVFTLRPR